MLLRDFAASVDRVEICEDPSTGSTAAEWAADRYRTEQRPVFPRKVGPVKILLNMADPVEGVGSTVFGLCRRRRYPTHRSAMAPAMGHAVLVQALRLMKGGPWRATILNYPQEVSKCDAQRRALLCSTASAGLSAGSLESMC